MAGRKLDFKIYIEGVEVPFVQVVINATANQPSQAQIAMVPTDSIYNVRPRSLVHIFFFDDYVGPEPFGKNQTEPIWRLLWEGEVLGFGFNKSSGSRSFTLMCADLSNYWASCKQYFLSGGSLELAGADRALFIGSKEVKLNILDTVTPFYQKFFVGTGEKRRKISFPEALACMIQGFTDNLVYWETLNNRLKLSQKIVVLKDANIGGENGLMQTQQFERIIREEFGNLGGQVSLLDFLNHLKQFIYYAHVPIIAPPFLPVDNEIYAINLCPEVSEEEAPIRKNLRSTELANGQGSLVSFLFKPQIYMSLPPRCNVFFPDMISSIGFQRNFLAEYTRAKLKANHALIKTDILQSIFVAPAELAATLTRPTIINEQLTGTVLLKSQIEEAQRALLFQSVIEGGEIPFFMTEEEYEKGIIPLNATLPFAKYSTLAGNTKSVLFENMVQVTEYQLQLARAMARTATVTMEFNPWCVLGFPCAIFDSSRSYFANIANITHHIDAVGGAFTRVDGSLAKEMIIGDEEIVGLPQWLNRLYHPDKVHSKTGTYAKILGCDALGPTPEGLTGAAVEASVISEQDKDASSPKGESSASRQFDLAKVADRVYQLIKPSQFNEEDLTAEYDKIGLRGDSYAFAEMYRRRNIATLHQVFGSVYDLGAQDHNNVEPPISLPIGVPLTPSQPSLGSGFGTESSHPTSGTPFDYRPLQGRLTTEGTPSVKRTKGVIDKGKSKIKLIGNLDRPGHKRDPIIEYRRETTDLRALDGR